MQGEASAFRGRERPGPVRVRQVSQVEDTALQALRDSQAFEDCFGF